VQRNRRSRQEWSEKDRAVSHAQRHVEDVLQSGYVGKSRTAAHALFRPSIRTRSWRGWARCRTRLIASHSFWRKLIENLRRLSRVTALSTFPSP
jgi:hypothetical protein